MNNNTRFERQLEIFGGAGQERLRRSLVLICGLGGLGSHVSQLLAYLGVSGFILTDPDVVEQSNLNRLIGATADDVGRTKVEVAERLIHYVEPKAKVLTLNDTANELSSRSFEDTISLLIGCVDNDAARLDLFEWSSSLKIPYLDLATGIDPSAGVMGGRICFSYGRGCLMCLDELDQEEIRVFNSTDGDLEFHEGIYGIKRDALLSSGPSVVTVNGLIGSMGVSEAQVFLAGLAKPAIFTEIQRRNFYSKWTISEQKSFIGTDCYFCNRYL